MSVKAQQRRLGLLAGCAVLALGAGFGTQAVAQAAPEPAHDNQVSEVIVTATKREQALSKAPVAVSAYSGEQIAANRITNFDNLAATTPGPTFVPISGSSGSQMQMRGLYASDDSPAFDTPVGVFIDDIYYGSVASFYPDFYDVSQVAVLRGPQGTTFGRNTIGGALQITSNKPNFDGLSGETSLTLRNYDGVESTGFLNATFSDKLAGRIAYSLKDVGGYQNNITTGKDLNNKRAWSARASLLYKPTDDISILGSFSYTHENSRGDGAVLYGQGALIASLKAQSTDRHDTFEDDNGSSRRNAYNAFVKVDWDLDWATFTSITGYRRLGAYYREDIDGSPLPISPDKYDNNRERQFSQEFRLTSPGGQTFDWIAGVYILSQNTYRSEHYVFGPLAPYQVNFLTGGVAIPTTISGEIKTASVAPFAEVKWNITDQWALTGGVRYTYDDKDNRTIHTASNVLTGAAMDVTASKSWTAATPRVILEYKPNNDLFFYASASKGFKSGGFNYAAPNVLQAQTPLAPESNVTYELGAKTFWFDRAVSANIAVYKSNTENLQVRSLVGTSLLSNNAGEAETKGVELEFVAFPFKGAQIGFNYAYTDAKYASYKGCAAGGLDCTGNKIPFTPRNSLNIFAQYVLDMGDHGLLTARVEDKWASHYEMTPQNTLQDTAQMSARKDWINAFLTYEPAQGNWKVQAWVRNLTDRSAVTFSTNYSFYLLTHAEVLSGLNEAARTSVTEPRTYGVTLTYRFE